MPKNKIPKSSRLTSSKKEAIWGYVFISPWILGFFIFTIMPMLISLGMSFLGWDSWAQSMFTGFGEWVGLDNFRTIVNAPAFKISLNNTLLYMFFSTAIAVIGGLAVGYALLKKKWYNGILRTTIYLPGLVIGIAFSMMMAPIFDATQFSFVNQIFISLGIPTQSWLSTPYQAIWVMIFMCFWGLGGSMIVFIAGFKNIDPSQIEAAQIDGATESQILFRISIPQMTYVIIYQAIMGIIYGLQVFDLPLGLATATDRSGGGMGASNSLATLVFFLYRRGFRDFKMAEAAAAGWLIFLLSSGFSLLLLIFVKTTKYYKVDD